VSYRPSKGLEEDPAIAGSVVRICARATLVGEEEVSQWCPAVKTGGASCRWLRTLSVGTVAAVNLVP
jgi:hypothetical protein